MKLYLLERNDDNDNYDIYEGFVISADSEEEALQFSFDESSQQSWPHKADSIKITEIGKAHSYMQKGVILSDFAAG